MRLRVHISVIALVIFVVRDVADATERTLEEPRLICTVVPANSEANAIAKMSDKDVILTGRPAPTASNREMKIIGSVTAKPRSFGPNIEQLLTPQPVDAAWKDWVDQTFEISPTSL